MPNDREYNYREWLKKAQEDELSAKAILKENAPSTTVCFLSQQMVEKYLKGLLVSRSKDFPKIHDLLELETLLLKLEPNITDLHEDLKFLNRYYIETRYPGDYPEFSRREAEEAFAAALRVKEFVLKKLDVGG